jgi:hypothetical protein
MKKTIISLLISISLLGFFSLVSDVSAQALDPQSDVSAELDAHNTAFLIGSGYSKSTTVGGITASVIRIALGFLATAFIILLIYGGYTWMMARGNEEEARKAMKIIQMAVIGLVIIVAAYSITHFVFSSLSEATYQSGSINP